MPINFTDNVSDRPFLFLPLTGRSYCYEDFPFLCLHKSPNILSHHVRMTLDKRREIPVRFARRNTDQIFCKSSINVRRQTYSNFSDKVSCCGCKFLRSFRAQHKITSFARTNSAIIIASSITFSPQISLLFCNFLCTLSTKVLFVLPLGFPHMSKATSFPGPTSHVWPRSFTALPNQPDEIVSVKQ